MKECTKCVVTKALTNFVRNATKPGGYSQQCKDCDQVYRRTKVGLITTMYCDQKARAKKMNYPLPAYTKQELIDWVIAQPEFDNLYGAWVKSNYLQTFTPTVSRINSHRPYTLNNIELSYYHLCMKSSGKAMADGTNNKLSMPIAQLDLKGNFLREFYSISEAARQLSVPITNIAKCCRGERKTAGGFKWSYA